MRNIPANISAVSSLLVAVSLSIALVVQAAPPGSVPTADAPRAKAGAGEDLFRTKVAPLLERSCLACHNDNDRKGGLSLESAASAGKGGESGDVLSPGKPSDSILLDYVSGERPQMPKGGKPLGREATADLRAWITAGAPWPAEATLKDPRLADASWWSMQPLRAPELPKLSAEDEKWCKTPIDRFILSRLREKGLSPSPEADRRVLIRRLYFDLIGLAPSAEEIEAFVADRDERAYERLVERLLAMPQYGERWARHWLDVVHYGDTHGFDKDKVRPNAWPYRDYVVRSLNEDKPYGRFVREQLAGDVLFPNDNDSIVALGFLAAGPFDYVGHIEVPESKMDGQIARLLDRDDMVRTTMETFTSMTVGCARCHNHKFDPITQDDYYSLQAVFAAVDRADRPYESSPQLAAERAALTARQLELTAQRAELEKKISAAAGPRLAEVERELAMLSQKSPGGERPEFGYHSAIEAKPDAVKWVQIDLGSATKISQIVYVGCHDTFNNIGAGFGFPPRFKIELSDDSEFKGKTVVVLDRTGADAPNPLVAPQSVKLEEQSARYVRFTATKLALRQNDYNFALGELMAFTPDGRNAALGKVVSAHDSIEAPVRWGKQNLVDGYYYGAGKAPPGEVARLTAERESLRAKALSAELRGELLRWESEGKQLETKLAALPTRGMVFAAATEFTAEGGHVPTRGKPREISVLRRGDIKSPLRAAGPGAVESVAPLTGRFTQTVGGAEGARRAALAEWIVDARHPLTWRSLVNRVWYYHFGRGIVDSLNDFGRMGSRPTHPELLDWLAVWFRDEGKQSLKELHQLIVLSAAYRQSSTPPSLGAGAADPQALDAGNQFLWRMNRRKLEAEAVRDAVLQAAGKLDLTQGGPGFRAFGFKDDHSPHYLYEQHDADDVKSHRRSLYRFVVRSVPDPFLETLDCADPSQIVERRNETMTALQALSLLNNKFMVRMAEHLAARVDATLPKDASWEARVDRAMLLALGRTTRPTERAVLAELGRQQGLSSVCRLLFNMNEFVFVD